VACFVFILGNRLQRLFWFDSLLCLPVLYHKDDIITGWKRYCYLIPSYGNRYLIRYQIFSNGRFATPSENLPRMMSLFLWSSGWVLGPLDTEVPGSIPGSALRDLFLKLACPIGESFG
jgi:hypothetical protein